jgi:FkbM family methyltransferase
MAKLSIENVISDAMARLGNDNPYSRQDIERLLREMFYSSTYESDELATFPQLLDSCDRFIDVGANAGRYMLAAANHLRKAEILAIEANPYLMPALEALKAGLEISGNTNTFRIVNVAIMDDADKIEFYLDDSPTLSSVYAKDGQYQIEVKAVSLDKFFRPSLKTFLKIDVEGAEYRVLKSARRFLESDHTAFFLELHGWGDRTLGKYPIHVDWMFLRHGYAVRRIGEHFFYERGKFLAVFISHITAFPMLALRFLVHKFFRPLVPTLRRLKSAIQS